MKLTVKFDNYREGRASFSFKIWLEKENLKEVPELYLLINKREGPVILEMIDVKYNKFLTEKRFKDAAGADYTEEKEKYQGYTIEKIQSFEEDPDMEGKELLNPENINIEEISPRTLGNEISKHINGNDILLKILPMGKKLGKAIEALSGKLTIAFQFRIFFRNFPSNETLKKWESSSEPWSVDIDIHKEKGLEGFKDVLKYPKILDLWVNIPNNHLFIASSPVYKSAFKLKKEDIQYKTYKEYGKEEAEFPKKFETMEGDYAVQISNDGKKLQNFQIICVSPFLPGEKPHELKEGMKEFKRRSKELEESQRNLLRNMVSIFGIFVTIFSFIIISANYASKIQLPQNVSSFKEMFLYISALVSPIFLFLIVLLIITYVITRK